MSSTNFQARLKIQGGKLSLDASTGASNAVFRIGFWSAVSLTALCVLELVLQGMMFVTLANGAIETNAAYYLAQAVAFLTTPLFVVLMACLFSIASDDKQVFALCALAFGIIYATLGGINYYVQMTAVRLAVLNGMTSAMAPFLMPNLSVMFAFDILGYFFMTLSLLAVVALFPGQGLERTLRWVLVANFGVGVAAVGGNLIGNPMLLLPILPATWILAGGAVGLLAMWFRRQEPVTV